MKKTILTMIGILALTSTNAQNWSGEKTGNSFDGFSYFSAGRSETVDNEYLTMYVQNFHDEVFLNINSASYDGEKGGRESLSVYFYDSSGNAANTTEVLIAFNDETKFYRADFKISGDNYIYIPRIITPDYNTLLDEFDIVTKLKLGNKISIRVKNSSNHKDYTISLSGSTASINKTVRWDNSESQEGWGTLEGLFKMVEVSKTAKFYHQDIFQNIENYAKTEIGKYYWVFADHMDYESRDEDDKTIFTIYDVNNNVLVAVPVDVWSKDAYYDEGGLKQYNDEGELIPFDKTEN